MSGEVVSFCHLCKEDGSSLKVLTQGWQFGLPCSCPFLLLLRCKPYSLAGHGENLEV